MIVDQVVATEGGGGFDLGEAEDNEDASAVFEEINIEHC